MASGNAPPGFNPPLQARSRAALQRILVAAEQVLAATGFDEFTMAAVADRAGLSVGAIYRRFEGKEQLLNAVKDRLLARVEEDITVALGAVDGGLSEVVDAFTRSLADGFSAGAHVIPHVVGKSRGTESSERSRRALEHIERLFLASAMAHAGEIRRAEPLAALLVAFRTITAACVHRTVTLHVWPDGISWNRWSQQVADMATVYLTSPEREDRPA
ncbi:TetR/AcrR family transcriptional regulator [Streptomyces sp. NPDC014734]|uniref:TetR/AcrR family transcriptional regulator n=1 Tax=Streptomyces sp. NPDC014734 TaxID=3364886 RepID=UPI0036F6F0AB